MCILKTYLFSILDSTKNVFFGRTAKRDLHSQLFVIIAGIYLEFVFYESSIELTDS